MNFFVATTFWLSNLIVLNSHWRSNEELRDLQNGGQIKHFIKEYVFRFSKVNF